MEPIFHGFAQGGRFYVNVEQAEQKKAYLQGLEGKELEEIIRKPVVSKTLQQLRYFHGVVCRLASEASGYTRDEVKGLLKGYFLTQHITAPDGKEVAWVPSLEGMKKDEMGKFIDDCIILCAKHWQCVIPPPDQVNF